MFHAFLFVFVLVLSGYAVSAYGVNRLTFDVGNFFVNALLALLTVSLIEGLVSRWPKKVSS
jgi:hypothetical protein